MGMRAKNALWILSGTLAGAAVIALIGFPLLARPSNCGGNTAALYNCKQILTYARMFGDTNTFPPDANQMPPEERDEFFKLGKNHWTGVAQYWVRTNGWDSRNHTQIVVFCEKAFGNVPQPTLGNLYTRNPAHAVGFANGTAGLISPGAFAQIDKNDFASLSDLEPRCQR